MCAEHVTVIPENAMVLDSYIRIRKARFEELPGLAAIEQRAGMRFSSTAHAYVCDGPNVALEDVVLRWRTGFVFVAADQNDTVVGFALGGELAGEAFLQEIDVEPSHGRRGIGTKLLEATLTWMIQHGFETMVLSTFVDVPWNAPFYARYGFCTIPASAITPAMKKIREQEMKAGLVLDSRVFMRLQR